MNRVIGRGWSTKNGQNFVAVLYGNLVPLHGRLTCRFSQSQLVGQMTFTYTANTNITVYRKFDAFAPLWLLITPSARARLFLQPTPITQLTTSEV